MLKQKAMSFRTSVDDVGDWVRRNMHLDFTWANKEERIHRGSQIMVGFFEYVGQLLDRLAAPTELDFIEFVARGCRAGFYPPRERGLLVQVDLSAHTESAALAIESLKVVASDLGMTKDEIFGCPVSARQSHKNVSTLEQAVISSQGSTMPSNSLPASPTAFAQANHASSKVPLPSSYKGVTLDDLDGQGLDPKVAYIDNKPAIECFGIFKSTCSTPNCKWCKKRSDSRSLEREKVQ